FASTRPPFALLSAVDIDKNNVRDPWIGLPPLPQLYKRQNTGRPLKLGIAPREEPRANHVDRLHQFLRRDRAETAVKYLLSHRREKGAFRRLFIIHFDLHPRHHQNGHHTSSR